MLEPLQKLDVLMGEACSKNRQDREAISRKPTFGFWPKAVGSSETIRLGILLWKKIE